MNILVPVDGSANSLRAVAHAVQHLRASADGRIHLLHVQPPIMSGDISKFVTREMFEEHRREQARLALAEARALLDAKNAQYEVHIANGPVAETIVEQSQVLNCAEIIMGTRGMGTVASLVLGSIATRVVHLAAVPVTLVK